MTRKRNPLIHIACLGLLWFGIISEGMAQDARGFDEQALEKSRNEYVYGERPGAQPLKSSTNTEYDRSSAPKLNTNRIVKIVAFGIVGLAALIIVYLIIKQYIGFNFKPEPVLSTLNLDEVEDIRKIDFVKEIKQAEANGDFKTAIRLYYLHALQGMTNRNIIQWEVQKTNADYLREIRRSRKNLHASWRELTYAFDYVWYGELPLDQDQYPRLKSHFQQFIQAIK